MTHRDTRAYRPPVVHGRRTRVIAALIGFLISVGVPVVVLGVPGLTADGRIVAPDDPAGLGIPGAPPDMETDRGNEIVHSPTMSPYRVGVPDGPLGVPGVMLEAYQRAERVVLGSQPGCHLSWSVLAGIGKIESGHASGGRVDAAGNTLGPILGPRLDGSSGTAAIPDTDRGVLDEDPVWDHAVGPMQFIPSSWRAWGVGSPDNIYGSTLAAGRYLCAGGADLSDPTQLQAAVLRYNHSAAYVDIVLQWAHAYLRGVIPIPLVAAPSATSPPATTSSSPAPTTTTTITTPPPLVVTSLVPQPPETTTTPLPTPSAVTTTMAPVPTTPPPSPSPTTDPPPTSALPAGS